MRNESLSGGAMRNESLSGGAMRNESLRGGAMRDTFEYAVLRVVPRVERGEALNAGVLVYCRQRDYLGSRLHLDVDRLRALDPTADAEPCRPLLTYAPPTPALVPQGARRSARGSGGSPRHGAP
jgi:hypothetical protein